MDEDRVAKRQHETPIRPERVPRSPGGTSYAMVVQAQGSSSTESTPVARPAKTRTIQSELTEEDRVLNEASETLAAKDRGSSKGGI